MRRRTFLQQTGWLTAGSLLPLNPIGETATAAALPQPGVQLFTFFSTIDKDVEGTLEKIAAAGYKNIESAFSTKGGYYGMKSTEFAALLRQKGLSWKSHHAIGAPFRLPPGSKLPNGPDGKPLAIPPMRNLTDNMQELVDEAAAGGVTWLVCANTPINTLEDINASIVMLNKTQEACGKAGLNFAYHNHDAEFRPVDGKIPYELFLNETPVKMELDIAWCLKGGKDPRELFDQYPGRFPLWHLKDTDAEFNTIMPIGEGTIDFKRVFSARKKAGLSYYFVEHDMPKDAMASITTSYTNLRKILPK